MTAKGMIIVHQFEDGCNPLVQLRRVIMRNIGTSVVPLSLTASENGWIVKVGAVRTKLISTKKGTRLVYRYHEIVEPIFLRCEDRRYYLEYHETWRNRCTVERKEYKLPKWRASP